MPLSLSKNKDWQIFFAWLNFRILNFHLGSSVYVLVKCSFSKNPAKSSVARSPHHQYPITPLISGRFSHLLTSSRWCPVTLACLQNPCRFSQNPPYPCFFLLVIFPSTDFGWPPFSLAINSHLPMHYLKPSLPPSLQNVTTLIPVPEEKTCATLNKIFLTRF